MHPYVHSSTIHNSQDMETTHVTINRWMRKEDVVHAYSGILLIHKKEWNVANCINMDDNHMNIIIQSEMSQKEKDKYNMISLRGVI